MGYLENWDWRKNWGLAYRKCWSLHIVFLHPFIFHMLCEWLYCFNDWRNEGKLLVCKLIHLSCKHILLVASNYFVSSASSHASSKFAYDNVSFYSAYNLASSKFASIHTSSNSPYDHAASDRVWSCCLWSKFLWSECVVNEWFN